MIITTASGRTANTADLEKVQLKKGGTEFKITIPVACDTGQGGSGKTCFINVEIWGKRAVAAAKNLVVGQVVNFSGTLEVTPYTRKNGEFAGSPGQYVAVTNVSHFEWGAKPQNASKGPICEAWYEGDSFNGGRVSVALPEDTESSESTEDPEVDDASSDPMMFDGSEAEAEEDETF